METGITMPVELRPTIGIPKHRQDIGLHEHNNQMSDEIGHGIRHQRVVGWPRGACFDHTETSAYDRHVHVRSRLRRYSQTAEATTLAAGERSRRKSSIPVPSRPLPPMASRFLRKTAVSAPQSSSERIAAQVSYPGIYRFLPFPAWLRVVHRVHIESSSFFEGLVETSTMTTTVKEECVVRYRAVCIAGLPTSCAMRALSIRPRPLPLGVVLPTRRDRGDRSAQSRRKSWTLPSQ